MSSEISAYHGWPWRVATNFGENNIAMFIMRLLLWCFSTTFLTHENAFWPEWRGRGCSQTVVDESKRTETSARQTNVNFARMQRQLPAAPTPSSPRIQCTDKERKTSLTCPQRERDGRRGGRRKSGALQLQRELRACVHHAQSSLFRREEARQSAGLIDILTPFNE